MHAQPYQHLRITSLNILLLYALFGLIFNTSYTNAQNFLPDTTFITFSDSISISRHAVIDSIVDNRSVGLYTIEISEKKRYLFVPVDWHIITRKPFLSSLLQTGNHVNTHAPQFKIIVDELHFEQTGSMFTSRFNLFSAVRVVQLDRPMASVYNGTLLYDLNKMKKPFGKFKYTDEVKNQLIKWRDMLYADLTAISKASEKEAPVTLPNFRSTREPQKPLNLIAGLNYVCANNQLWDTEYYFGRREANTRFLRSGSTIRYRRADTFDAIEFALASEYLYYRLNPKLMFRGKFLELIGFNRWKNFDTVDHKLWDAFIIDFSLSQSLLYSPLDKKSIQLGIGILENAYYIYSKDFTLDFGILLNLGMKL